MPYAQDNLSFWMHAPPDGPRVWVYSEASPSLDSPGYINNGGLLGMKAGELILCLTTSTGIWSSRVVVAVDASSGAVDLSHGATIADERLIRSKQVSSWIEDATTEIETLKTAAKANPKAFWGNRSIGTGEGLQRVRALLPAVQKLNVALGDLNRAD
jgi:hypothetical protein